MRVVKSSRRVGDVSYINATEIHSAWVSGTEYLKDAVVSYNPILATKLTLSFASFISQYLSGTLSLSDETFLETLVEGYQVGDVTLDGTISPADYDIFRSYIDGLYVSSIYASRIETVVIPQLVAKALLDSKYSAFTETSTTTDKSYTRTYLRLTPGVSTVPPISDVANWLDIGASNVAAVFDDTVNTVSEAAGRLGVVLTSNSADTLSIFNMTGEYLIVTGLKDSSEVVYYKSLRLEGSVIADWYQYFLEPFSPLTEIILSDIPAYPDLQIEINVLASSPIYTEFFDTASTAEDFLADYTGWQVNSGSARVSDGKLIVLSEPALAGSVSKAIAVESSTTYVFYVHYSALDSTLASVYIGTASGLNNITWNATALDKYSPWKVSFTTGSMTTTVWLTLLSALGATEAGFDNLVIYEDSKIKSASAGHIYWGRSYNLGNTQYGATSSIVDYSKKDTDELGSTSFVKRNYSKKVNCNLELPNAQIRQVQSLLASLRATPCTWIGVGEEGYEPLAVFGFYRDFSIDVRYFDTSYCSLEIEGLV